MKTVRLLAGAVLLLLFVTPLAFAKLVSGKISAVDAGMKKMTLQTTDAATGKILESEMWLNEGADASLEALKPGDEVWVEAEQDPEGNLKVSKVSRV